MKYPKNVLTALVSFLSITLLQPCQAKDPRICFTLVKSITDSSFDQKEIAKIKKELSSGKAVVLTLQLGPKLGATGVGNDFKNKLHPAVSEVFENDELDTLWRVPEFIKTSKSPQNGKVTGVIYDLSSFEDLMNNRVYIGDSTSGLYSKEGRSITVSFAGAISKNNANKQIRFSIDNNWESCERDSNGNFIGILVPRFWPLYETHKEVLGQFGVTIQKKLNALQMITVKIEASKLDTLIKGKPNEMAELSKIVEMLSPSQKRGLPTPAN